jgi:hypothetical protein
LQRVFLTAAVALHFILIVAVCCRDTFTVIAQSSTLLPHRFESASHDMKQSVETVLGQTLTKTNPVRQIIGTYLHAAGIEAGYGFFAPNIPGTNEITFELHYGDGHVEHRMLTVHESAAALRFVSLLDIIVRAEDESVREGLIKYLAYAVWRDHRDVASIRAILGRIDFPPPDEFAGGEREANRALHVYDFTFEVKPEH